MKTYKLFLFFTIFSLTSCIHQWQDDETINSDPTFNFENSTNLNLKVSFSDNYKKSMSNIPFSIVTFDSDLGYSELFSGLSDKSTVTEIPLAIGNHIDEVLIVTPYLGLPDTSRFTLNECRSIMEVSAYQENVSNSRVNAPISSVYTYLGSFDEYGIPNYLEPANDYIPQDMLDLINTSLPETRPVPIYNPEYLSNNVQTDVLLKDSADAWITFVHEGAGWTNALGYYTYDLSNPPTSKEDIKELIILFPNVSLTKSGGGLVSGNKIYLGRFSANTGIGWFLVPNGWNNNSVITKTDTKFSNKAFNTFTSKEYSQHTILLKDEIREILLLGMEDTSRPGGDNDFNDAVFYITVNPFTAVIMDEIEDTKTTGTDNDNDGVANENDAYPDDPTKAFDVYSPGKDQFGSLAFEDMWPEKGDYDMNDLVMDYQFKAVTNTKNEVIAMDGTFILQAMGATFHNGFGVELAISPDVISDVKGHITGSSIQYLSSGLEKNQSNAVIILFEDGYSAWKGTSGHVNTVQDRVYISPDTLNISIQFTMPIKMVELGYAPFNPFIFHQDDRTLEIHLPGKKPTDLADTSLLGTGHDLSDFDNGKFYKSYNNFPWALNLPVKFDYPIEYQSVDKSYLFFNDWTTSGGSQYSDWYIDKNKYRLDDKIYKK